MEIREAVRQRRSIRKYKDTEIPEQVLKEVLEDALWAPSGVNRQNWFIYAVRGEKKDALLKAVAGSGEYLKPRLETLYKKEVVNLTMSFFTNLGGAPVILLVYIPKNIVEIHPAMSNRERYLAEHERFVNLLSASALIQNILLLAKSRGLGTCWMTAPKYNEDQINEIMGITDKELVAVIPIGYPDQNPPAPPRKGEKIRFIGFNQPV